MGRSARVGVVLLAGAIACAQAAAEEPAEPVSSDYTIGVEDVIRISVWGEPNLSQSVKVRPDGRITIPLVNDVPVLGLTPAQVRSLLTSSLSGYIKDPNVTVAVEEINSFKVFVLGEVMHQGPLSLKRPTRLLQALAEAGGFTQYSKKQVTLIRDLGGTETRIRIDFKRLVAKDSGQDNVYLKPGDTLVVE